MSPTKLLMPEHCSITLSKLLHPGNALWIPFIQATFNSWTVNSVAFSLLKKLEEDSLERWSKVLLDYITFSTYKVRTFANKEMSDTNKKSPRDGRTSWYKLNLSSSSETFRSSASFPWYRHSDCRVSKVWCACTSGQRTYLASTQSDRRGRSLMRMACVHGPMALRRTRGRHQHFKKLHKR